MIRSYDLQMGKPNLEVFAEAVAEIAERDPQLLVVTSDSRGSGRLGGFAERAPDRVVEVGIAEQNLVGISAGLAAAGKSVFAVSPASFLSARSLEQIKNDICYSDRPVVLIGISAGVSYGALGSTHHSLHDFAVLRAINNIIIVAPADNWEAREAIVAAADSEIPVYIRFGKKPLPILPRSDKFELGQARLLREGSDAAIIATGETVWRSLLAAESLSERGISVAVLSVHTLKPLDEPLLLRVAGGVRAVVVAEEHSIHGGLGDACASVFLRHEVSPRFAVAAIPDEDTVTGTQEEILDHYGISAEGLAERVTLLLGAR